MDHKKIVERLWDRWLIPAIKGAMDKGKSQDDIAAMTELSQGAISAYLRGDRREGVKMESVLKLIFALEVPMKDVIEDILGPDQATELIEFYQSIGPDLAQELLQLKSLDPEAMAKVRADIAFYASRAKKK